ncbi:hypothetical protein SRHO_G00248970 [Serrasalmus rhombeus]
MRIFGVPENSEGDSVTHSVEELLHRESLPEGTELLIQRANRAAARRPGPGDTPRPRIMNFLRDYAAEVVQKRRACVEIKKTLKAKGIRSQTPLTRIRTHWTDGPRLYSSARGSEGDEEKGNGWTGEGSGRGARDGRVDTGGIAVATRRGSAGARRSNSTRERETAGVSENRGRRTDLMESGQADANKGSV